MSRPLHRLSAAALAVVLALGASACGSAEKPKAEESPSVPPYAAVPDGVDLTVPGTQLKVGQHAVIAWRPKQDEVAALDVDVRRLELATYDKWFQGWSVDPTKAATTPYFVRATVTNVSDSDLGGLSVPLWGEQDGGTLVAAQPFAKAVFEPCHPTTLPTTFAPGATTELCFVFAISPGHDLAAVAFQPQAEGSQFLKLVTWTGKATTKVQPPKPAKKTKKRTKKAAKQPTKGATKKSGQ